VGPETHVHKITNVTVFLYGACVYFMIFMRANPLLGPWEGVGPEKNLIFLGQNDTHFDRCYFMAQKSLDFQGQLLPMDAARIKIITSYAI
jgi:hypothetical protein